MKKMMFLAFLAFLMYVAGGTLFVSIPKLMTLKVIDALMMLP